MSARPATLLAFDYGMKKIGVAVGQTLIDTATPLGIVKVKQAVPDWRAIGHLIETWQPDALIVGLPVHMDGTEQPMTGAARKFIKQLKNRFQLPVHATDERLSSNEAKDRLAQAGKQHNDDDPVAAQVILEGWLATNP